MCSVAAVEALRKKERPDETQFTTKIGGKLVWVPVISFCKVFILSYAFDALLCPNWPFPPPDRLTRWITLTCCQFSNCTWDVRVHAKRENSHHIIIKYYNCGSMYHWHRCRAVGEYILHTCQKN